MFVICGCHGAPQIKVPRGMNPVSGATCFLDLLYLFSIFGSSLVKILKIYVKRIYGYIQDPSPAPELSIVSFSINRSSP